MSEHCGYVVMLEHVRPHTNADRLQIATIFGNDVIIDLKTNLGDIGIYFPTDIQLSEEYCKENDLVRRKDENGNPAGGYLDPNKRNIRAMKLRGEKSDGLFMPISSLNYIYQGFANEHLNIGDKISVLEGHEICRKYIPRTNPTSKSNRNGNHTRKKKAPVAPLFAEHADTEQLVYNLGDFHWGDLIEITLKMHGTSQRTGYLPIIKGYKRTLIDRIKKREGTPIYEWGYISGTRRTVLEGWEDGGFYGTNAFRKIHADKFEGKLHKGETVYYEVVGFTDTGTPIMAEAPNKRVQDKEFTKTYGETTTFSYGCEPDGRKTFYGNDNNGAFELPIEAPQSECYVYRMTMTNEDGDVIEYTPDFMRYRCEQMGVKYVPVLWKNYLQDEYGYLAPGEWIQEIAEKFYDGPDPIGKTHIREGVVIRIINRPKFTAYKHKNFYFKVLEGIIKDTAAAPDMEEAEDLVLEEENNG